MTPIDHFIGNMTQHILNPPPTTLIFIVIVDGPGFKITPAFTAIPMTHHGFRTLHTYNAQTTVYRQMLLNNKKDMNGYIYIRFLFPYQIALIDFSVYAQHRRRSH